MVTRAFLSGTSDTAKSFLKVEKVESMEWKVERSPEGWRPVDSPPRVAAENCIIQRQPQTMELFITLYFGLDAEQNSIHTFL